MSAAGLLLVLGGALLVYAGITGQSVVGELQKVLSGDKNAPRRTAH